jgi:integrase
LAPKTISNHLGLLRVMFKVARRWRLVQRSPVDEVEAPRVEAAEMNVLTEPEIARLLTAYRELEGEAASPAAGEWWRLTRRLVEVALATALRRGELLALRWADVELLDGRLTVRQAYVRGQFQAPKSRASRRTLELGPRAVAVLGEVYEESRYRTDDSLVFCHPALGAPLDPSKLAREYMRPALARPTSRSPSAPGTTSGTPHSRTRRRQATRRRTCNSRPATRRAPSPSATSTPRRCCSPVLPAAARSACFGATR